MRDCSCLFHRQITDAATRRPSEDQLFNPQAFIPPRPTITNIQWISGTQYVSSADMDILSTYTAGFRMVGFSFVLTVSQSEALIDRHPNGCRSR